MLLNLQSLVNEDEILQMFFFDEEMYTYKPERGSRFLLGFNSRMPKIHFKTDL